MRIHIMIALTVLVAVASCLEQTVEVDQSICTIEDQEAGTCPPGGWNPSLALPSTRQWGQGQLPGAVALDGGCYSEPRGPGGGVTRHCHVHYRLSGADYLAECRFNYEVIINIDGSTSYDVRWISCWVA